MPIAALIANFAHPMMPSDPAITVQIMLRWVHFVAGITWVGLLYFFVLVKAPFLSEIDAATKGRIYPGLMSRAMWWFRWSSVLTVFVGFGYWNMIVVADAKNAGANGGHAIWTFLIIWTLASVIEIGVVMSPAEGLKSGAVFGVIVAVIVIAASWGYVAWNSHGWESNRLLSIGIGGGIGWFMMFNVWGLVWRMQNRMIRWTEESVRNGTPMPEQAAKFARLSQLVARVNFVLSFPMLFFMAAASHYPFLVQ